MDHSDISKCIFILLVYLDSLIVLNKCFVDLLMIEKSVSVNFNLLGFLAQLSGGLVLHQRGNVSVADQLAVVGV
jgi:hypothetical protein